MNNSTKFLPWGNYAKKNDKFSICKVFVAEKWIYDLYKLAPDLTKSVLISSHKSFQEAETKSKEIK